MRSLQNQYNLIKEGKSSKDVFLKSAKSLFPNYIPSHYGFNETVNILKEKSIISESLGGVVTKGNQDPDWFKIFNENIVEAKAEEKKPTKEVVDTETKAFDYKDPKNIDNIYGPSFLKGFYTEMCNPKNEGKTVDELKEIVAKNLNKNLTYYTENGQFGLDGVGYTVEHPGLGTPKEAKGKYKSSGYGDLKENKSPKLKPTDKTIRQHINQYSVSDDPYEVASEIGERYGWNEKDIEKAERIIRKKYLRESKINESYDNDGTGLSYNFEIGEDSDYGKVIDRKEVGDKLHVTFENGDTYEFEKDWGKWVELRKLNESYSSSNDFEGTGLLVYGRTTEDNQLIDQAIEETGFHGIFNAHENYWFFPEKEETIDRLENELETIFIEKGINARFEGQFNESLKETKSSDFGFYAKSLRDVKKGDFVWRIMERFNPQLGTYYTANPYKVAKVTGRKVFISSYGDLESYDRETGIETKSEQPAYGSADYRIVSHQEMLNLAKENPEQFKRNYNTIINFKPEDANNITTESLKENTDTFSDYSNNELYAYYKNTKDPKAKEELKKRSQNIKNLTRTTESLKEQNLRSVIQQIIKEELNEGYGMSLEDAKAEAKHISKEEGVVQHVEETEPGSGKYRVSDWYDSDLTVISYEGGLPKNENMIKLKDLLEAEYYETFKAKEKKEVKKPATKKAKTSDKIKAIETQGSIAALEAKIEALEEEITSRETKMKMATENEDFAEFVNEKKIKMMEKEVKQLQKAQEKYIKEYKKYTGEDYQAKKEIVDETEEMVNENEIKDLGDELANIIKDELKKKKEIDEFVDPISILSTILATNTLINILSKYITKLFKKYNFGKGEEAAKKIYNFTNKLENDFKKPIERIIGLFTKDDKTKKLISDGLFVLLLLGLGAKAGSEAISALKKSDTVTSSLNTLKAALKGKDIMYVIKNIT